MAHRNKDDFQECLRSSLEGPRSKLIGKPIPVELYAEEIVLIECALDALTRLGIIEPLIERISALVWEKPIHTEGAF